jgi:2-hydroxychromene-2-carboxylate isomerase
VVPEAPEAHEASFYFDLGSPYAYLAAERLEAVALARSLAVGLSRRNARHHLRVHDRTWSPVRAATDDAHARGVTGVPTLAVGDQLFWGDDRLEEAADALGQRRG